MIKNKSIIEIIGMELFEALQSKYVSSWQNEFTFNNHIIKFDCVGESQWEIRKNGKLIDIYSFNMYEQNEIIEELNSIFELK